MANTTITALPAATTPLTGTEVVPIVQSGVTKKVAVSAISGSGSVTSVTGTSPVASSGGTTPAISLASGYGDTQNPYVSKTANYVLAAPNGSAGVPTFRAIVAADIPQLNQNTTGTAAGLSSTLAIASGGTGQTSANAALNGLLPSQTGQNGKVLSTNGTDTSWIATSGTGTVTSVALSTPAFLTVSGSPITASGTLALSYSGTALPVANGGTGATTTTAAFDALAPTQTGNSGKYLTTNGATTSWATVSGGGSPAGSDTQVQYNSGGTSFGASSAFTFTSSTGLVTATSFAGALNGTVGASTPTTGVFTTATARSTAVQDSVILQGRAGGTNSYGVTLTPTTLTASRTLTLPDASGTILQTGTTVTVGQGGTGISSGTSGGIPYFSATSTIASSAALTANALVVGGGAGVAPATVTTGSGVVTALGVNTGAAGAFVVNGGALGTPSGGTVTNLSGTASININGTVGATTPAAGTFTTVGYKGSTSGTIAFQAPAVAGSATYTLPSSDGTSGQVLSTNGSGTLSWVTSGSTPTAPSTIDYLVVAAGGGGGGGIGGGGGAGGYRNGTAYAVIAATSYTVTVGASGTAGSSTVDGGTGGVSSWNTGAVGSGATIQSAGGGGGACGQNGARNGVAGGSGGGGGSAGGGTTSGGAASPSGQGSAGGGSTLGALSGGGGGANAAGTSGAVTTSGSGGNGNTYSVTGSGYARGGGGGAYSVGGNTAGSAGSGGAGNGTNNDTAGGSGVANTGDGGGGGGYTSSGAQGGAGGSGVVIISYSSTFAAATATTGSPTITTSGGNRIYTFTGNGTITF